MDLFAYPNSKLNIWMKISPKKKKKDILLNNFLDDF